MNRGVFAGIRTDTACTSCRNRKRPVPPTHEGREYAVQGLATRAPELALHGETDPDDPRVRLHLVNVPHGRGRYRHPGVDQRFAELVDRLQPASATWSTSSSLARPPASPGRRVRHPRHQARLPRLRVRPGTARGTPAKAGGTVHLRLHRHAHPSQRHPPPARRLRASARRRPFADMRRKVVVHGLTMG
jgi:hypothetical protein